MTDRPIIFSAPMVRALIDDRKTQTRRLAWGTYNGPTGESIFYRETPWVKVRPGDRLWVREAGWWTTAKKHPGGEPMGIAAYRASYRGDRSPAGDGKWCSPIHMPRWASRITLTVTEVRRQRLQEISEADAIAEGMPTNGMHRDGRPATATDAFASVWSELHGARVWDANPEVVALTFTVALRNIDAKKEAA
jgi:hypothetical protein